MTRTLTDIAEDLRKGLDRQRKCTLLIGAGCSKTAGIPLAADIVRDIKALFPRVYERALTRAQKRTESTMFPSYGDCMAELDPGPQRDLIRSYIDKARLNWAHVGIGSLVANGYVDRLLTTNFDPLIAQGCAVFNEFPAVYDLTMSATLRFEDLPDKAVFHLHGQRNGFSLLNDPHELLQHRDVVEPLFRHAREGRSWIVVGYSGENDPLFELIQQNKRYDYALYWIGREKEAPAHVQKFMGDAAITRCHYLQFAGADEFFVQLSHELGHFPPPFMNDPLGHMAGLLDRFTDFPTTATVSGVDFLKEAKHRIQSFQTQIDSPDTGVDLLKEAKHLIKSYQSQIDDPATTKSSEQAVVEALAAEGPGRASKLWAEAILTSAAPSPDIASLVALTEGNRLFEAASVVPADSTQLLLDAAALYERAAKAKPDMHEALNNWGNALTQLARRSEGDAARALLQQASDKYAAALKIKPDKHTALHNWANALNELAQLSEGDTARALWQEAIEKYDATLALKPDMHETLIGWGDALDELAQCGEAADARAHALQAFNKYDAALKIKPDSYEALNNWGYALSRLAERCDRDEARALLRQAIEKYQAAHAIKPDLHKVLNNWGAALDAFAQRSEGDTAVALWHQAIEKYDAAQRIKPDAPDALNNWGNALHHLAQRTDGDGARALFQQAFEKYDALLKINPNTLQALNNWGLALDTLARRSEADVAGALWQQAFEKYDAALKINPEGDEALNNWATTLLHQADVAVTPEELATLLSNAFERAARAYEINPRNGAYNAACAQARRGKLDSMVEWLDREVESGNTLDREHLFKDTDFDAVRDTSEFKAWLTKMGWA